ncbi:hypothetical protein Syun_001469 [Stephania yunnanensis]|uniref:Uncharacterized protein n=1 Tax=Stephania yunnanensis TaxID=152371 RepID=A0AAP0Q7T0_9MAGN
MPEFGHARMGMAMTMMIAGGKEMTKKEFEILIYEAGVRRVGVVRSPEPSGTESDRREWWRGVVGGSDRRSRKETETAAERLVRGSKRGEKT